MFRVSRMRKSFILIVLITLIAVQYFAQDVQIRQPLTSLTVIAKPLLNCTYIGFSETSMVRDVWNESFEGSLTAENHYWYGAGFTVAEGTIERNSTLDPGFEEVSSSTLNPNVSLPSWFIHLDGSDVTVKVSRSSAAKYHQSYSAYVETRFVNTSTQLVYLWQTPGSIYNSCSSGASNTIDDNLATYWVHKVTETEGHWAVYDLGQSYLVRKVRVYSGVTRITDVDVYVSDDPQNFGSKVVELWDPVNSSGWSESPGFYKEGRYIKIQFTTTHFKEWLDDNTFYEFDAYVRTSAVGHTAGGLKFPQDYFIRIPCVYLSDTPVLESALFLDDAGVGSGYVEAFYMLADVEIQNETSTYHIIYVVPITVLGSPSQDDFSNTTDTKYIYNVVSITSYDAWVTFNRNLKNDYESIWGQAYSAKVSRITIKNDFYNPETESETNTPFFKANYDAVSLELSSKGNEEEMPNGSFEAPGWVKLQQNKLQSFNYTKDSQDSKESETSFFMNATCDTSGGSGSGFGATKHGVVAIGESSFIREVNDTYNQRLHAYAKIQSFSGVTESAYSYVGIRLKFVSLSNPSDVRYLHYCLMLHGQPPSDSSTEKYLELVKFYNLQTGVWYEISRHPIADGGWENVKIAQIALVVAYYYGQSYSSTNNANAVVRFDYVGIDTERGAEITIRDSQRSTDVALDGSYSLEQNRTSEGVEFDVYECGAENENNTFYIAFPYHMNFSIYFYVTSLQDEATVQVSLAIDDGPSYALGYLYELIYYYGSSSGVSPVFSEAEKVVEISSSIPTSSWVHLQRNWTLDMPEAWPVNNPRIEAVGLRIWTSDSITIYWDLAAVYGTWHGAEKTVQFQSINEILMKKFNTTEYWNVTGGLDPGIDDFVDNNQSDVDSSTGVGSHSNFTAEKYGPDLKYDVLTEAYSDQYIENLQDYVDNNSSNVDSFSDRGSHSNFTAEQYGPDSTYDTLTEEYLGPGVDVQDYVDNNSSNVDGSPSVGTHSNFTAMQYGPDAVFDILTEENTNPPPNDVTDYVDNNSSDVDGSPDIGSHSNFTAEQYGPDSIYDTLTEENVNPPLNDMQDYVDNNSSDVDGFSDRGSHSNFTAEQYGPDSIYDTLTEEFTGTLTNSTEDFVDDMSNVDGVADKGTHSNFTAEKYGPDSVYDTLTETNTANGTGEWTTPQSVYDYCGEEGGYEASKTIDDILTSDWRHYATELHWIVYDMGQSMKITKVRIYPGTTPQQYTIENVTVYVSSDATFDDSEIVVEGWNVTLGGWDESPSFSAIGRYIKLANMDTTQPQGQMKMAFYEFDAYSEPNYELDLEVQWTNVNYNETNEELCIYGGTMGAENIRVDLWNGATWINLVTDLYQGWNNISVSNYLTSSTFTIRFKGATETSDIGQDSYEIDAALLHVWTPGVSNYELDLEVQFTDVDYDEVNEELCIYAGSLTSESLQVDYWTGTGWNTLISSLTASSWNNVSVSLTSSTFTIRFKGTVETGDGSEDSWQIDAVLLHVWTGDANYKLDLEVQWTDVDYDELNEELCIYTGSLTSEDLRVYAWTASSWVFLADLAADTWNNVSVSNYLTSPTFTIRFRGSSESGDTVQDNWQIDAALLSLWTPDEFNYQLDLEAQFTDVNYGQENERLCIRTGDVTLESLRVEVWTGGYWTPLFTSLSPNTWNNISVSNYLTSSTFTIRFKGSQESGDTTQDSYEIDAALLHVWTIQGHQIDLEVQFTNADYNEEKEYLCIYAGSVTDEALHVDVWTGFQWATLLNDLAADSWNNVSVSNYLNSPTFTVRFKGSYEASEDDVQDSYEIDAALLHVWTFEGYQIDLEVQFTDVDTEWRDGELRIYTGSVGGESLRVDYWTGSNWITIISALKMNGWSTGSIQLNGTVTIRFKGTKETDDFTQDSWYVDAVLLHTWYIYASEDILRANSTSPNQWYYKWWNLRKIVVENETGTYEISGNSTSEGMLSFHDNEWNPEDDVDIYNNDTSGYVIYNVTDFKLTAYGKNIEYHDYIEIKYTILFCRPLGVLKYTNTNRATGANEPDEYGVEYWHTSQKEDGTWVNYLESSSSHAITYFPDF